MVLMKKRKNILEVVTEKGQDHLITFSIQLHKLFQKSMKKHMKEKRTAMKIQDTKDRQLTISKIKSNLTN